jgi:hypothetical protein
VCTTSVQPEHPALLQARAEYRNIVSAGPDKVSTVLVAEPLYGVGTNEPDPFTLHSPGALIRATVKI